MYYIWSNRHKQWWGPDRSGYVSELGKAGIYTKPEAADIQLSGLPSANIAVETALSHRFGGPPNAVEHQLDILKRL